jgi:hypothetical protein
LGIKCTGIHVIPMRNTNASGGAGRGLPHLLHCTIHLIQPPDHALLRVNFTFEILFLLLALRAQELPSALP